MQPTNNTGYSPTKPLLQRVKNVLGQVTTQQSDDDGKIWKSLSLGDDADAGDGGDADDDDADEAEDDDGDK